MGFDLRVFAILRSCDFVIFVSLRFCVIYLSFCICEFFCFCRNRVASLSSGGTGQGPDISHESFRKYCVVLPFIYDWGRWCWSTGKASKKHRPPDYTRLRLSRTSGQGAKTSGLVSLDATGWNALFLRAYHSGQKCKGRWGINMRSKRSLHFRPQWYMLGGKTTFGLITY